MFAKFIYLYIFVFVIKHRGKMKRTIKFRAWLDYMEEDATMEYFDLENRIKQYCGEHTYIMQFTGLTDKNGVEIYEGDLVKLMEGHSDHLSETFRVCFQNGSFGLIKESFNAHTSFGFYFQTAINNGIFLNYTSVDGSCFEIIGNIHENPELL